MIAIHNDNLTVACGPNGRDLAIVDEKRGTRWALDEQTLVWGNGADLTRRYPLLPLAARAENNDRIVVTCGATDGPHPREASLEIRYTLHDDCIEVRLPVSARDDIRFISMPGGFAPAGERLRLLLPIMQGMLWDGRGPDMEDSHHMDLIRGEGSHDGFSMALIGYLGERGGLLLTAETRDDARWWFGKDPSGRFWAANLQVDSLGTMRYERIVRIYPTNADIVALARRYRKRVQERGRFITWDDKIAARPGLERLFGALMCFVGYCQDDIDYVDGCRKLKAYGFDRALVYPARFNVYREGISMGGRPAVRLSGEQVAAIEALGYDVAPWSWLNEALDDGTGPIRQMLRRNPQGEVMPHWAMDDQQWYHVCPSFIEAHQQDALDNLLSDMTWDHFDVLACVPPLECYALDHPRHAGRPLSRAEERECIRRAFLADQARGWAVSSENFNDAYSREYDLGSVKAWPQYSPWPFWPVPLTMLVYHDSLIHSWWEVHNYNSPWFSRRVNLIRPRAVGPLFEYGGGRPRLMAALDALMGCPPDVFPFGAQYGWTGRGHETFLYRYRFEDPEVQLALREALPVARLHRRIGRQEMVHFKILSEDGCVQESAFADGTRVVANFSRDVYGGQKGIGHVVLEGIDSLMPESWVVAE